MMVKIRTYLVQYAHRSGGNRSYWIENWSLLASASAAIVLNMRSIEELAAKRDRASNFPNEVCGKILAAMECLWWLCGQVLYVSVPICGCRTPSWAPIMLISDKASECCQCLQFALRIKGRVGFLSIEVDQVPANSLASFRKI